MNKSAILALAVERAGLYKKLQRLWWAIHYVAGSLAVVAGGLATAATAQGIPESISHLVWLWGLSASVMSAVVTFLKPEEKAQPYKNAEYELAWAIAESKDKRMKAEGLSRIVDYAQRLVLGFEKSAAPRKKGDK